MKSEKIIAIKSTVPVGTGDLVEREISDVLNQRAEALDFFVVSNPEFLKEGAAVSDAMRPDRIIIGTDSMTARKKMKELYTPFSRNHDIFIFMDRRSSELSKYAANCMLATKISLMNEFANLAERLNCDIEKVRIGIGSDPRIGFHFIYPGCGYGGSCFPKDISALINTAEQNNFSSDILKAVKLRNESQKQLLFSKISRFFQGELENKTIAIWGLSFKPNTDDIRDAASIALIDKLFESGAKVQAFDPEAMEAVQSYYQNEEKLFLCGTKESALKNADVLVIVTEWQLFRAPDFNLIESSLNYPAIFDGRNMFEPELVHDYGLKYFAIGRGDTP